MSSVLATLLARIPAVRRYGELRHLEGFQAGFDVGSAAGYRAGREDGLSEGFDNGLLTAKSDEIERAHRIARRRRAEESR